jgi:hypothetical protein
LSGIAAGASSVNTSSSRPSGGQGICIIQYYA